MAKRKIIPYNKNLVKRARVLRNNMTFSEVLLWEELKNKNMMGFDFDRQKPISNFIVDFYCKDLLLAIEIDGESHGFDGAEEKDEKRQQIIESYGVHFLRFDDQDVKIDISGVVATIRDCIEQRI